MKAKTTTPFQIDAAAAADLNKAVLKRCDPEVEEVLATAGQVCLYRMNIEEQQWARKNVEGSLFLIKRRTEPQFQFLVLNRSNTDNYTEPIVGNLELELNPPYLMYTRGNDEIHGIWFAEAEDLTKFSDVMTKVLARLPNPEGAQSEEGLEDGELAASPAPAVPSISPNVAQQQQQHRQFAAQQQQQIQQQQIAARTVKEDGFWDTRAKVTPESLAARALPVPYGGDGAAAAQQAPTHGGELAGLLRNARQKHDMSVQQIRPLPNAAGGQEAAAEGAGSVLTPSQLKQFSSISVSGGGGGGVQQAETQPRENGRAAGGPPVPQPQPQPPQPQGSNPLQQLFAKAASKSGPLPGQAPAPPVLPQFHAPPPPPPAHHQHHSLALPPPPPPHHHHHPHPHHVQMGPMAPPPVGAAPPALAQAQVRDKMRLALSKLVHNDAFIDMLAAEFHAVGLL